jgi:hypothetical protein
MAKLEFKDHNFMSIESGADADGEHFSYRIIWYRDCGNDVPILEIKNAGYHDPCSKLTHIFRLEKLFTLPKFIEFRRGNRDKKIWLKELAQFIEDNYKTLTLEQLDNIEEVYLKAKGLK